MGVPKDEKPLVSKGAGWVLFVGAVAPIPFLIGVILLAETSATSRALGALFIALGTVALVGVTVALVRRAPRR